MQVPYDPDDYHDPTAGIGGAPPARSALGLRLVLAIFGFVVCAAAAVAVLVVTAAPAGAVVLGMLAAIAMVDVAVVSRRIRRER